MHLSRLKFDKNLEVQSELIFKVFLLTMGANKYIAMSVQFSDS